MKKTTASKSAARRHTRGTLGTSGSLLNEKKQTHKAIVFKLFPQPSRRFHTLAFLPSGHIVSF